MNTTYASMESWLFRQFFIRDVLKRKKRKSRCVAKPVNKLKNNRMTQAEKIYERFVNYEWNEVSNSLKESILKAIEYALKEEEKI